jgi:hypothetical protein
VPLGTGTRSTAPAAATAGTDVTRPDGHAVTWYDAGPRPLYQVSPGATNDAVGDPGRQARDRTAPGGRVTVPYRPLFRSSCCHRHHSALPAAVPAVAHAYR